MMLLNCVVGEDSWESLGQHGDPTSPSLRKSVLNIHWKTDPEAEAPVLWPPDVKNWLTGKAPDAGKDWRQEEKGTTEDEMVGWHHRVDGYEFGQAPGVGDGQGSLACCSHMVTKSQTRLSDWSKLIDKNIETYGVKWLSPGPGYVKCLTSWMMGPNFTCFKL